MSKIKKNIKSLLMLALVIVSVIVGSNLIVVMKIKFTNNNVGQVLFTKKYFVEGNDYNMKIENFREFMLDSGWMYIEIYDEKMIFRKGNLQKEITLDSLIEI